MQVVYPEQGFPEIFIIIQTWKNDGNIVDVKGTSSRRYEGQHGDEWHTGAVYLMLIFGRQVHRQTSFLSSHFLLSRSVLGPAMCTCVIWPHATLLFSSFASNIYCIFSMLNSRRVPLIVLSLRGVVNDIIRQSLWGCLSK